MLRKSTIIITLTLVALLVLAVPAFADDGPTDDEVNAIASQLYCPVCENIPLDTCPTQACIQWRDVIREKLAEGWSEVEIKNYFVEQYGDRVLAEPPPRGFNWLIYILPPVVFLGGVVLLVRVFRAWRQDTPAVEEVDTGASDDPYITKLEEELRKRA